jgi:acetyl-CoA synthetase
MGKPLLGLDIRIVNENNQTVPAGETGEIVMNRRGKLFPVKDSAIMDEDGYFWHKGRSDDVIITSGWTVSPTEIEETLLKHENIEEAAVIGVPDKDRGNIIKAFIKARQQRPGLEQEIKDYVKERQANMSSSMSSQKPRREISRNGNSSRVQSKIPKRWGEFGT